MKYKILNQTDNRVELFVLYEDNTFAVLNLVQDILENVLKNAYILSKDTERLQYEDKVPTDLEVYERPQSVATKITNVDFNNFTADIYDQFGERMNVDVAFEIEGTGARIENGELIEDEVEEDTSYFIVARYGDLEEKQKRTIYAPVESIPSKIELLNNKVERLASENEKLKAKLQVANDVAEFQEELIVELAMKLY